MKGLLLIAALMLLLFSPTRGQIPVILRVSASEQSDTTGCNFVKELSRISYFAIMNGKAKLWNSPSKEIRIMPASLAEIEKSSGTSFLEQDVVFIYEYWTNINKVLSSQTSGFLFSNKSRNGADVEYGYVEYQELQSVFLSERVMTNANGNYNANLASYIDAKNYNFNFLQFMGKVITNKEDSRTIFSEFIGNSKFNTNLFSSNEIPQKKVTRSIDFITDASGEKALNSNKILVAFEKYLRQNEEVLYNLGGEKVLPHIQKGKWRVTKIELNELWKKINGEIFSDPLSMTVFINDSALNEISYREMLKMELKINEQPFIDYLKQQQYLFIIRQINHQEIPRSQSYAYQKALLEADWKRMTEYIGQY